MFEREACRQSVVHRRNRHLGDLHGTSRHVDCKCRPPLHWRRPRPKLDEVTWILTTYLVANAVILPMSAWLSRVFGRKDYYSSDASSSLP